MNRLIKMILIVVLILSVLAVWFYIRLSKEEILPTNEKTEILTFSNGKKIYLRAKSWGVAGNHEEIVFSENPITNPNKEKDFIFYTNEVIYKVENNTLRLYACDCNASIPKNIFKEIEVVFKDLKNADEIKDYSLNYKKYGLQRISIYK